MRNKKVLFIFLLLTFPLTSVFTQIPDQEYKLTENLLNESAKLDILKSSEKKEIIIEDFFLYGDKDSISVITDMNKSFWSVDIGWKNYKESMTFGLSMGIYLGKNWYLIPSSLVIHSFNNMSEHGINNGYGFIFLFGKSLRLEKLQILFNFGPEVYLEPRYTEAAISIGLSERFEIRKGMYFSFNFRSHLVSNINYIHPFRVNHFFFSFSREF